MEQLKSHTRIKSRYQGQYETYVFRAHYCDMSNMSRNEFIWLMIQLLNEVFAEYSNCAIEENKLHYEDRYQSWLNSLMNSTTNKKRLDSYKRESSKQKFIEELKQQAREKANSYKPRTETFFDFMPVLYPVSQPSYMAVTRTTLSHELGKIYDELQEYIHMSKGLLFMYDFRNEHVKKYPQPAFRPWIELILPDDVMNELKEKERASHEEQQRFYDSLQYKGD